MFSVQYVCVHACMHVCSYNTGPLPVCCACSPRRDRLRWIARQAFFSHFILHFYLVRCNYDGSFVGVRFGRAMRAWLPSSGGGRPRGQLFFPPHTSGRRMRTCVARRGAVREILFSHARKIDRWADAVINPFSGVRWSATRPNGTIPRGGWMGGHVLNRQKSGSSFPW